MDDFMFWMLSNGGGLIGIIAVLSVVMVVLSIFTLLVDEGTGKFNRRQKNVFLMMFVMACTCLIFSIDACAVYAPVSWFRGLPAGEIKMMKKEISKHDGSLTIYQFYEAQLSVQRENHRQGQLDAMRIKK